jgi:hypothetical protein
MATTIAQDHPSCWSETFWIQHCEGFRVEGLDGHPGIVEGIKREPNGEVLALLVREGDAVRHLVPVSHVESVDGWEELVRLRTPVPNQRLERERPS